MPSPASFDRAWDCATCTNDVFTLVQIMSSAEAAEAIVLTLQGEALCKDPVLDLNTEQVTTCQEFVRDFMPPALKAIFLHHFIGFDICTLVWDVC